MSENDDEARSSMIKASWKKKLEEAAKTNNYEEFAKAARNLSTAEMFQVKDSEGRNVFQMSLHFAENGDITKTAAYQYITQRDPDWETSEKIARAAWQLDNNNYSILSYLNDHTNDSGGVAATLLDLKKNLDLNPKYSVSNAYMDYYDQLLLETHQPLAYGYNRAKKTDRDGEEHETVSDDNGNYYGATAARKKREREEIEKNEKKYGKVGPGAPRVSRDDYIR